VTGIEHRLVIAGKLPNLNDYIQQLNISKFRGAELKRATERDIAMFIRSQLKGVRLNGPITLCYTWYEPSRKRDLDNIVAFGMKCIHDALVSCGVIANDGWENIAGFSHAFFVDSDSPRIEIILQEQAA